MICYSMKHAARQTGIAGILHKTVNGGQRTSMPQMTMPGTTSRVLLTTASSAVFMSRAAIPGMPVFTMPSFCNLFTPAATQDASDAETLPAHILSTNVALRKIRCRPSLLRKGCNHIVACITSLTTGAADIEEPDSWKGLGPENLCRGSVIQQRTA